jgi:uncharacterized protein YndB with AHSA1/START domain
LPEQITQQGYLVLADISGYTSYLAGVELDHAHDVLADLLETIVSQLKALLTISKLEGDAVFGYVAEARVARGETLFELVESTYVAFRDRLEAIRRRTTCDCNACRAIPTLDLKFIVHHGDYIVQTISGIHELVGSDVNLVHRLLKNHVAEATGWKAYALFTAAALEHLAVPCDPRSLHFQTEEYEHLGPVQTSSLDLRERYQAMAAARRIVVSPEEAHITKVYEIAAPPAFVWDWANDPYRRSQWMQGTTWTLGDRPGGRTGAGARNHCAHGKHEKTLETVLDWKPFEYFTVEQAPNDKISVIVTSRLEPLAGGQATRLSVYLLGRLNGKSSGPVPRLMMQVRYGLQGPGKDWERLARVVSEDYARQAAGQEPTPEPAAIP